MNQYNPKIHHRRSIRLKGYDYSQAGLYFITICCQDRMCRFGHVEHGEMKLNDAGTLIETEWFNLKTRFPNIELHDYVVMPNHFHAILEIVGATLVVAPNNDAIAHNNDAIAHNNDAIAHNNGCDSPNNMAAQNDDHSQNDAIAHNGGGDSQKGQPQGIAPTDTVKNKTVGDMMDAFKSITTVEYIHGVKTLGWQPFDGKLWQRNYHEHIICNEQSYRTISKYIINNPVKWSEDKFYIE